MEKRFPIRIPEEEPGQLELSWDELWLTAAARSPLRGEGLCKLWLAGEGGRILLGTMVPERGELVLRRKLSLREVKGAGGWPPLGVESMLIWEFEEGDPFPRTDLFCFARLEEKRLSLRFDREGQPVMPD